MAKRPRGKSPEIEEAPLPNPPEKKYATRATMNQFYGPKQKVTIHLDGEIAPSTIEVGMCTKEQETAVIAAALAVSTTLNSYVQALAMIFPMQELMDMTRKCMIGVRHPTPMSPNQRIPEEDQHLNESDQDTILLVEDPKKGDISAHPNEAVIMKFKTLIAALAVGKNFLEDSLNEGICNRASAFFASINKEYQKAIEMKLPYQKYLRYKSWLKQFPLLISRIIYLVRKPDENTKMVTRALFHQADILNQGAGMTHIFITHSFIFTASVAALTQKSLEKQIKEFLDEYDRITEKYPDSYKYLGTCIPDELTTLHKTHFELLFYLAHCWFVKGGTGQSRERLKMYTTVTLTPQALDMYMRPVDIRSTDGNSIDPELAHRIGIRVEKNLDIAGILEMLRTQMNASK